MNYLYPMKPTRIHFGSYFDQLMADPEWVVELKYNGARGMVYVHGDGLEVWDRHHNKINEARIPDVYVALRELHLEAGTVLDGELYPRGVAASQHPAPGKFKLALFDVMVNSGMMLYQRQALLRSTFHRAAATREIGTVHLVEQANAEKRAFVDRIWTDERAEGVVIKLLSSLRMDDPKRTRVSPHWVKVLKPTKVIA